LLPVSADRTTTRTTRSARTRRSSGTSPQRSRLSTCREESRAVFAC